MKKRILCLILVLVMCLSICATSMAATKQAGGRCYMNISGHSVSYSGYSSSGQTEDVIGITVILWEQRGTKWYEVASVSDELEDTNFVDAANSMTVDGGHYYKVTGTHTSEKNGKSYSGTSETTSKWIP